VTRKICDFSPEQLQNILAIVRLYRGQAERYLGLVAGCCAQMLEEKVRSPFNAARATLALNAGA